MNPSSPPTWSRERGVMFARRWLNGFCASMPHIPPRACRCVCVCETAIFRHETLVRKLVIPVRNAHVSFKIPTIPNIMLTHMHTFSSRSVWDSLGKYGHLHAYVLSGTVSANLCVVTTRTHTHNVPIMWLLLLSFRIHHVVIQFSARGGSPSQLIKSDAYPQQGETDKA